jgi:hypothetical protein
MAADRRLIPNLVIEARRYSALAVDTLVELTKDNHADSTRYNAAIRHVEPSACRYQVGTRAKSGVEQVRLLWRIERAKAVLLKAIVETLPADRKTLQYRRDTPRPFSTAATAARRNLWTCHLSADAITKRLSDMTDAELAALEQRMIAAAPIVLEATAEVSDDSGDVEDSPPDAPA